VMLGHPVALITKRLDTPREVERIAQRLAGIAPSVIGKRSRTESRTMDRLSGGSLTIPGASL
jgi:hypothetical protein